MTIKKIMAVLITVAFLDIGAVGTVMASPQQIDCSSIKTNRAVVLDCSKLPVVKSTEPEKIDIQEPRRSFTTIHVFQELREDIQILINKAAKRLGLSPALVGAVAQAESGGNPNAVSPMGAIGVMQLMPSTAAGLGVNPYDPEQNIYGGAQYLRYQLDRFEGDVPKAVAAYNAGPGAVEKYNGIPPYRETREYVSRVMMLAGGGIN